MISVLSLDPGITTGWALGIIDEGLMKVSSGQDRWNELGLWNALYKIEPDVVVYERFESRGAVQGVELFSRNLIGVIELYWQLAKGADLPMMVYRQMPQDAIGGYWSDTLLRRFSLYKSTTGGHANDAARHLLRWFEKGSGYQYNKKGYEAA